MNTAHPTVSILLCAYNGERYLPATLDSLLAQSFTDFELLALDDGSTDRTGEILRQYASRDSRIRVIAQKNSGIVASRNELMRQARGEFFAVSDADDLSLPDRLQRQVDFLRSRPDHVCVGGNFDLIDDAGRMLTTQRPPHDDAQIQDALLRGHCAICHSAGMMRREAPERVGGYRPQFPYAHDLDLWLRIGEVGKLANLDATVLKYRLHGGSISEKKCADQRDDCRRSCADAAQRRGVSRPFEAAENWRPGPDRASQHQYALRYGWWAYNSGHRGTALIYATKAIAAMPLRAAGYKLLLIAALKPINGRKPLVVARASRPC